MDLKLWTFWPPRKFSRGINSVQNQGLTPFKTTQDPCKLVTFRDTGYVPVTICSNIILVQRTKNEHTPYLRVTVIDQLWSGIAYKFGGMLCMSICNTITFESPDIGIHFFTSGISQGVKFTYEGHLVKVKVTHRSKKGWKSIFLQCQSLISNNSSPIKHTATNLCTAWGFWAMVDRMVWRHLCYITITITVHICRWWALD